MTAYFNEIDPFAAAVLRELIADNLIAPGIVDERSIEDVSPDDLRGFKQCHFFAGIGGWSLALRLAGVPDDRSLRTASCPCQPFSAAGQGVGFADERHLWPSLHYLVEQRRPDLVFGEQVASKDALEWVDLVHSDLAATGYALGVSDLCAAGVGAPHIRQRLYWVAHPQHRRLRGRHAQSWPAGAGAALPPSAPPFLVADDGRVPHAGRELHDAQHHVEPRGIVLGRLADSSSTRLPLGEREVLRGTWRGSEGRAVEQRRGAFWAGAEWLACSDGKARAVEPGIFPLATGFPNRVGTLRGAGNAIVPQVAQEFIEAYFESWE